MELLDDEMPEENALRPSITLFGKVFYRIEIVLWAVVVLMVVFMPYFAFFSFPLVMLFYLILGSLFPFRSGVFHHWYDKVVVLIGLLTIPIFITSFLFKVQSWPYSSEIIVVSAIISLAVFVFLLARLVSGYNNTILNNKELAPYSALANKHLRFMLIRTLPLMLATASMAYKILI
ncbi:hypothetical protein BH09BAC1_BH09BAC1_10680 [soil metagenome]